MAFHSSCIANLGSEVTIPIAEKYSVVLTVIVAMVLLHI